MFSRKTCYFFVRPKRSYLEVCVFLGRTLNAPQVRRIYQTSKTKAAHIIQVRHRDEVEAPITDWLREAYDRFDVPAPKVTRTAKAAKTSTGSNRRPPAASPRHKRRK